MKRQKITILSLCIICSLFVSGCSLFSNKEKNENSIETEWEENTESVKQTENATESVFETEVTESAEAVDVTETEMTEAELTETEDRQPQNSQSANSKPETGNTVPNESEKNPSHPEVPSVPQTPPAVEEVPEVYVVNVITEQETLAPEDYKYGVTKNGVVDKTYEVYSDGTRKCVAEYPSYTYDSSTYNATDDQIRGESDSNSANYMGYYQEVLNLVNQIRAEAGAAPLTLDTSLCNAASMRALEMDYANYFEHARADGRDCFSVMDYYGCTYSAAGENIAAGYSSPAAVVEGWKNSSGHYANMISADFTKLGVGYCNAGVGEYGNYWVQLFSN